MYVNIYIYIYICIYIYKYISVCYTYMDIEVIKRKQFQCVKLFLNMPDNAIPLRARKHNDTFAFNKCQMTGTNRYTLLVGSFT